MLTSRTRLHTEVGLLRIEASCGARPKLGSSITAARDSYHPLRRTDPAMNKLLARIIDAHGDIDCWNRYKKVEATRIPPQEFLQNPLSPGQVQ